MTRSDYGAPASSPDRLHHNHRHTVEGGMTIQAAAVPMRLSVDITNLPAVYVSDTVSVYQVGTCGWFILRRTEFTDEDWLGACEVIGPDTYLDPGEWEALQGAETMFLPDPAFMPRSLSLAV